MPARNIVSNGTHDNKVRYSRLATDDDGYTDLQVNPLHGAGHSESRVSVFMTQDKHEQCVQKYYISDIFTRF